MLNSVFKNIPCKKTTFIILIGHSNTKTMFHEWKPQIMSLLFLLMYDVVLVQFVTWDCPFNSPIAYLLYFN